MTDATPHQHIVVFRFVDPTTGEHCNAAYPREPRDPNLCHPLQQIVWQGYAKSDDDALAQAAARPLIPRHRHPIGQVRLTSPLTFHTPAGRPFHTQAAGSLLAFFDRSSTGYLTYIGAVPSDHASLANGTD